MSRWGAVLGALDVAEAATGAASRWADVGHQVRVGTGQLWAGMRGLSREGGTGRWSTSTSVGRFLGFETAGDVEVSLDKLDTDMAVFESELAGQVKAQPTTPLATFYATTWTTFYDRWRTFYGKNRTWAINFWRDNRHERDGYIAQLQQMRDQAAQMGAQIHSPAPSVPAPAPDPIGSLWALLRTIVYVGLAVGGVIALLFGFRALRGM